MCLGNISKDCTINNIKKIGLKGSVKFFSVDFNPIDSDNIHRYLMKEKWYKIMLKIIQKMFIVLLSNIVSGSNHTKCISLSIQKCITKLNIISLHPNEYSEKIHNYPFEVTLDKCVGSCNTLNDLSSKVCVPNKNRRFKSKRFLHDYRNK